MPPKVNIRELADACIDEITKSLVRDRQSRATPAFSLDPIQRRLIESKSKYARVLAPAGSGKTRTLLAKAEDILTQSGQNRVLCLTFTNAAAGEFRQRSIEISPAAQNRLTVSTVNSFGNRLSNAVVDGLRTSTPNSPSFGSFAKIVKELFSEGLWPGEAEWKLYRPIYELSDLSKSLGFHHASSPETAAKHYDLNAELGMASLVNEAMTDAGVPGFGRTAFVENWFPFWKELVTRMWDHKIVTLDDQKYWATELLCDSDQAEGWLKDQGYSHLLVDEFQDINRLDLFFIQQVCAVLDAGLIIVGDDDQCIYEWRGCTSVFIRQPERYMKALVKDQPFESIILENNYRCPRNIVRHANALINHNDEREPKTMNPVRDEDANIRIIPLPAAYVTLNVVDRLLEDLEANHPKHTVAVVGRKKCQLIPIQILLAKRGARFNLDDDLNVFRSDAWKDLRDFLQMIPEADDIKRPGQIKESFLRLLSRLGRTGLSKADTATAATFLDSEKPETLSEAVDALSGLDAQFKQGYAQPEDWADQLCHFLESDTVTEALLRSGEVFKGFKKDFGKAKDDIFYTDPPFSHLADLAAGYGNDFKEFVRDMDIAAENLPEKTDKKAQIEVMTALRTKGREFDSVFVLDANDGIWPNKMSEENGHLEEERRLFYVTVTRAKNNLLFFESGRVQGKDMEPSRFLDEMGLPSEALLTNSKLSELSMRLLREMKI